MWNAERFEITATGTYTPASGSFGWNGNAADASVVPLWTTCRESFLATSLVADTFFYQHGLPEPGRGRAIAVFMGKIEDKLKLKGENRSTFQATSRRMLVKVTPGKFWKSGDNLTRTARMSLYSALLRCARQYRIALDNFDDALWSQTYTQRTRRAVLRFLRGNTKYVGEDFGGWQGVFGEWEGHRGVLISKMLVSPGAGTKTKKATKPKTKKAAKPKTKKAKAA